MSRSTQSTAAPHLITPTASTIGHLFHQDRRQVRTNAPLIHQHPHPRAPQPGHMRVHSLDGTEDIRLHVPSLMQHGQVPSFPFLGACVDQLLQKLLPAAKVDQGQHRADRLA